MRCSIGPVGIFAAFGIAKTACLIGEIVIGNAAAGRSSIGGFATFAVVKIHREAFTGIPIEAAIPTFSSINKYNFRIHNYVLPRDR
jgi:hypothetical protein